MHILLIHQAFAALNEPGGTRHHEIARNLVERGHLVTVIASPVSYLTGSETASHSVKGGGDVVIHRAYTYSALHKSFIHRVFSFFSFMISSFLIGLRVRNVDLVWGTSPPIFQGVTAWLLSRFKRVPFLFEVRDLWPAFAIAVGVLQNKPIIKASEWLERFLYRRADQMLVNSPGFIKHIEACGCKEIALVPNGADSSMFDPAADGAGFRQSHKLVDKFVVLYAGAHGMSNDLDILLDAASQLSDQPEISIVFLGDGKEKSTLVDRAAALGLTNVHFIPPVPKTEMGIALAVADACIAILKPIEMYKTVYPNKVFDYMAAGRPVILAIDGVIRDVVDDADAGIFVPPGNADSLAAAISTLASDRQEGMRLGQNGRRYVEEHFDRRELSKKMALIMEALVKE
ncbi:MAG: glycosyltransferase family 4 protein [Anaerolineales bacterium]|nr:glycosyltransferase family 4 protein [Chloroflexota bacterium]MBL6980307.1 glycosyltransferase family 4 protein [Anaerolineales bacterium]